MYTIKKMEELTYKAERRDISNASKHSSSSKFLKRKPDVKKIISGVGTKKRKQTHISQYFESEIFADRRNNIASLEDCKSEGGKYISISKDNKNGSVISKKEPEKMLQKVKSLKKVQLFHKQFDITSIEDRENVKNISEFKLASDKISYQDNFQPVQSDFKGLIPFQQRGNSKKSKTQFFIQQESFIKQDTIRTQDVYQISMSRVENNQEDTTKKINVIKSDYESLAKRNKILQIQLDACLERQFLLKTQQKHLEEMIREKDKIIEKLNRQKTLLIKQGQGASQSQIQKLKQNLKDAKNELEKELTRQSNLKQENSFLQNELIAKNQQLILVYDKYSQLQYVCNQERKKMKQTIQSMKLEVEKVKAQARQQAQHIDSYAQMQKWKQKILQQQEELKYLKIQNQCLLISKQELHKSQNENRKLKEERDYFKRKVLDHVKRSKTKLSQISSSGGSVLFELSEISIDE